MTTQALDAPARASSYAYIVLDELDRIVHVSSGLHAELGYWTGHVLWEHLPGAREIYGPSFTEARTGRLKRLTAIPGADGLAVHVEQLVEIDVTSLATLTRSLEAIAGALAAPEPAPPDRPARASLRALL